jgi:hypothetical protein
MSDELEAKIVGDKEIVTTIVIPEEKAVEPKVEMTADNMKEAGFSPEEIAMAEEQGQIKKPAVKSEADIKKDEAEAKAKLEADKKPPIPKKDEELTDEEEHEKVNALKTPNEKAMYWKQKKERKGRQEAQRERDLLKIKNAELEKKLKEKETPAPELDEFGNPIVDDPDRLITAAELDKRDKDKKEKEAVAKQEEQEKDKQAQAKLKNIYEQGRTKYADFDSTMKLAKVVLDTNTSFKVKSKFDAYLTALASNDDDSEEVAADIAYEIGKLHPDYKPGTSDTSVKDDKKTETEKANLKKILANQEKPKSSAALGGSGGGNRIIAEADLTPADVAKLTQKQFDGLSKNTQDRILKESCG